MASLPGKYFVLRPPDLKRISCVAAWLCLVACSGTVGGAKSDKDDDAREETGGKSVVPDPFGTGGTGGAEPAATDSAGPLPLRRLTRLEYDNTVRDLLRTSLRPGATFSHEGIGPSGFAESGTVSGVERQDYDEAAAQIVAAAVADLPSLMGCSPAPDETGCVDKFLGGFVARAYRRPAMPNEIADLKAFYTAARARGKTVANAVSLTLQAILLSPNFLYHWEASPAAKPTREGELLKLDGYALASRLSYFLWRSMPDAQLMESAASGKLATASDITREARRLLTDKRARDAIADFHLQWAHIADLSNTDKDLGLYPAWTAGLKGALQDEARAFVNDVILDGDGTLKTLMTATHTFANADLAKVYGATGVTGSTLQRITLDPKQRSGLFTQAAFLAVQGAENGSHPIRRGKVIWEGVVCGEIPPPPMNIPPPSPPAPNLSTRERFADHAKNACAAACHALIDPPGFAFEHYDGIGHWRDMDGGKPVDAKGVMTLPLGGEISFDGALELMQTLAASSDFIDCMASQWLRYAMGRGQVDDEEASRRNARAALLNSKGDVRELIVALVASKTFRFRQVSAGEVFQ